MIVATAGHVDHGKTALLRALTGVDADRLPEEKARGLTIDLGYVYDDAIAPGTVIGFVDVPGHERFIHNMLAGVTAIEAALLVVAADDGPMPQTREHLAILDLVGVSRGAVALTKTDMVADARVEAVTREIEGLLAGTGLATTPVFPVSSITGQGVEPLREALADLAAAARPAVTGAFRMPVDRAFHVRGAGLVVTGLADAGSVRVGDRLALAPAGTPVRVRGLRVQDRPAETGQVGDRCAVNIAGAELDKDRLHRGQWLVATGRDAATRRVDCRLRVLPSEERALKHGTPVHIHIGTADTTGRAFVLDGREIAPDGEGLGQLLLDTPVSAVTGDVVILRDQSARRTIGGGRVLDPAPPARGRSKPDRLARVEAMGMEDRRTGLVRLLDLSPGGLDLAALAAAWNLAPGELDALWPEDAVCCGGEDAPVGLSAAHASTLRAALVERLEAWHRANPDRGGMTEAAAQRALPARVHPAAFAHTLDALVQAGRVERTGATIRLKGHALQLTAREQKLWARIREALESEEGRPRTIWEISEAIAADKDDVGRLLKRAVAAGLVLRISLNRFLMPDTLRRLGEIAEAGLARSGGTRFTVRDYRDWSGLGRNLSIEVLEYFDRAGLTRRIGDERELRRPAAELFGEAGGAPQTVSPE